MSIWLGWLSSSTFLHGQTMSNSQLISRAIEQMVAPLLGAVSFADSAMVYLTPESTTNIRNLAIEQELTALLQRRGAVVFLGEPPAAAAAKRYRLEYVPVTMQIVYQPHRPLKNTVQRLLRMDLFLRMTDSDSKIVFSQMLDHEYKDVLRRNEISRVEQPALPYTIGFMQRTGIWHRLLEPLLIAACTGGIIYLFYSYRTPS